MNSRKIHIGNRLRYTNSKYWAKDTRGKEFDVTIEELIHIDNHNHINIPTEKQGLYEPIELTESLLQYRLDFKKNCDMPINVYDFRIRLHDGTDTLYLRSAASNGFFWGFVNKTTMGDYDAELNGCVALKYLHDLQNLLSSFGHELVILPEPEKTLFPNG